MSQKPKKNLIFLTLRNTSAKFDLLPLLFKFPFTQMQNQENKWNHPHRLSEILHLSPDLIALIIRKEQGSQLPFMKLIRIIWKSQTHRKSINYSLLVLILTHKHVTNIE